MSISRGQPASKANPKGDADEKRVNIPVLLVTVTR